MTPQVLLILSREEDKAQEQGERIPQQGFSPSPEESSEISRFSPSPEISGFSPSTEESPETELSGSMAMLGFVFLGLTEQKDQMISVQRCCFPDPRFNFDADA
ncbi:putative dolichyl-diphosphooligosaccharide--protein glycosyltransferase [Sesbania bispinosa]|nr:putative dolichyl-diphosphooligosaccharide--protein glycosyltransferase [Sesbania bispinosa]